jgi:hypothetical protein
MLRRFHSYFARRLLVHVGYANERYVKYAAMPRSAPIDSGNGLTATLSEAYERVDVS